MDGSRLASANSPPPRATDEAPRTASHGIGAYLVALILIAVVPLLVIAALLVMRQGAVQREAFERSIQHTSRALSVAVDRQFVTYRAILETLAEADSLRDGDMATFHELATRVADVHDAIFISMFDAAGRQIFNTLRPAGQTLPTPFRDGGKAGEDRPPVGDSYSIRHVLETGKPYNSDLFVGLVAGRVIFTVNVPVMRDGKVAYVLNAAFPPNVMTALLKGNPQFRDVPAVIFDRRGFIAGRWQGDEELAGTPVMPGLLAHAREADAGVYSGRTKEAMQVIYSYTRSPVTGWTATVGLERERLERDLRNTWLAGGLLAVGGLSLGLLLALLLASRLRTSIAGLADAGARNEPPRVRGLKTREIADLERALVQAAAVHRRQAREREDRLVAEARKAEAEEASRAKDRFIAILSHELRNPLAPIRNAIALLRRAQRRGESLPPATVDILERQSEQLARLVNDLLDDARINAGKITLHREAVDLRAVARHAIEAAMPGIEARGQRFSESLPAHPVIVDGDFARLSQVVANLLDNAAKYTPEGGAIGLAVRDEGGEAILEVTDTGRGIDAADLRRLFQPFQQAGVVSPRREGGLGLGLALAKALVDLHGGALAACSDGAGRGSIFMLRLPRAFGSPAEASSTAASAPPGSAALRVLVVDDNADAAATTASLLELLGHATSVAADGESALAAFARFDPDAVLLDIGLPDLDGYTVARRMRAAAKRPVTLVALTGWGQESDRRRSREAGFDEHLVKPVDPEDLLRALTRAHAGDDKT